MNTPELVSIGRLANRIGALVPRVRDAADALKIAPAIRLDGVPYYIAPDSARIVGHLLGDAPPTPHRRHRRQRN